ncbi:hypothetical protein CFOLD11_11740 [Clostridium folliculivorans]|uniref:Uncharacterized protein n=1 Tax=Clostridium folliculivorans TaxID=2886038 RepID=A0A9W6DA62_9CLOT|nr:hypothetical protein [Clostridium folliculivorans]GKU24348.1 hypothetical protein CFOLD11_11740 [Clostridium folliculivorans]
MDAIRITRLFSNNEKLSEKLLFELNKYKFFTESAVPNIAVLCSDDSLKNEISNIYDKAQSNYIIDNFSIAQENGDLLEKIMNTDAVIIYTNALKIAPKDLYDIVSAVSVTNKKVFVLLGGWNALPRETVLIKRRLSQVAKEFQRNDIVMVKGAYGGETVEGLECLSDAFKAAFDSIKSNFKEYRYKQEEALYLLHKKAVNAEINEIHKSIINTNEKVLSYLDFIYKKQLGLGLAFKNANIGLIDVVGDLKDKMDGLNSGEFVDYLKDSLDEEGLNDINRIVEKFKEKMVEKVTQFLEAINDSPKTDVNIKFDGLIQECINEMQYVVSELGRLNYVNGVLLKELADFTQEISSLANLQGKVKGEFKESMEKVINKLKGQINSIQVNTKKFVYLDTADKTVDRLETVIEMIKNEKGSEDEDKEEADRSKEESEKTTKTSEESNESSEERKETSEEDNEIFEKIKEVAGIGRKITDAKAAAIEDITRELIESAKVTVLAQMDAIMQTTKNGIQSQAKYYVDLYFQSIISGINKISDDLVIQKKILKSID